jgi:solute carrier family 24 (sodium/potassium/calcium exchanger), member 6
MSFIGVGGSGTYITHQTGQDVRFHFSSTLLVSTIGLLILLVATLIVVPYNNYWLSRSWGIFLIAGYTVVMIVNIVVEIKQS